MLKTFYKNKDKGVEWTVFACMNYYRAKQNGYTAFYLLPTISYERYEMCEFDDERDFNIYFKWLFWSLEIRRSWGDAYKEI